jgi:hypothetical protein
LKMGQSKIQTLKSKMDTGERINACRRRLRRSRAMQKMEASDAARREAIMIASLTGAGEGERKGAEAERISVAAQSPVDWTEHGAMPEVDRRPPSRARFSTEEETVRA